MDTNDHDPQLDAEAFDADASDTSGGAFSRRALLSGLGAAGAFGLATSFGGATHAMAAGDVPEALAAPVDGLVYVTLDALAFHVADASNAVYRNYTEFSGVQPSAAPNWLYAPLPIPVGSVVRQINVSYKGQPIVVIGRRVMGDTAFLDHTTLQSLDAGAGAKTQTVAVNATITHGGSYVMKVFCSAGASILGMEVGYIPPAQAFVPYTGNQPRVFDSRTTTKFGAKEERVIDLSTALIPTARAAVINLTATETDGAGFLAAFKNGITYPGNSSVNFSGAGATIANGVVCPMANGKIKVRTGPAGSHVIVDVIGSLL